MAELFGRRDGCAHGRGGSMHLLDVERGYFGGWGIVAGQLPIATGLALALVRQGRHAGGPVRARRRRGEHGRLARVAEPRRALAPPRRLPRRQQRVRHGHVGGARLGRARALPPRRGLPDARRARRRRRPRGGARGDRPAAGGRARGAPAGGPRGHDLPLPRPLGGRRRPGLPDEGRGGRAAARDPVAAHAAGLAASGVDEAELDGVDARGRASGSPRPSRSPRPARSPRSPRSPPACRRPAATRSSRGCGRAARSARRSSSSRRGSGDERRRRAPPRSG